MRIVIFTGGTGSIALQRGLYHELDERLDGVETKLVVNAYDNGLSTGAVRRVMQGRILGPSDVRKNQTTRLQLQDARSPWVSYLNHRFTVSPTDAHRYCNDSVLRLMLSLETHGRRVDGCGILFGAISEYFDSPLATSIDYNDFSLANIIYAGLARANDHSLRAAARIMAAAVGIADNVILNDDKSLFLGAITRGGKHITDEGQIVAWCNEDDPFEEVFFTDANGNAARPELCEEARQTIIAADLIILSSGTQWSSLIPTYASRGFQSAINGSRAKIIMVMNRAPDADSPSQTASDIVNILVPRYFGVGRLHVVADENGDRRMSDLQQSALARVASFSRTELSRPEDPADKHDPSKLARTIGRVFFREYLESKFYLFDYDGTLVARRKKCPRSSRFNVNMISRLNYLTDIGICTGNTIKDLNLRTDGNGRGDATEYSPKPLLVFADGGANQYRYNMYSVEKDDRGFQFVQCISPDVLLPASGPHSASTIVADLRNAGIPRRKIDNRGNALIAIKPVARTYRKALISLVRHIVDGSDVTVRQSGTTTIEIHKPILSKSCALRFLRSTSPAPLSITYVGDEFDCGNDHDIGRLASEEVGVLCLRVDSPAKTAFFLATLVAHLTDHVAH